MAQCVTVDQSGYLQTDQQAAGPVCALVLMTGQEWNDSLAVRSATPFDPQFAAASFGFFFGSVITLWVIAKSCGVVLDQIRKN